jgi:hypothetical protein
MLDTNESVTREGAGNVSRPLHFAGKFLLALLGVIVALRLIGAAFAFSRWTGLLVLVVIAIVLYSTARRWVQWLPGLLIFGVINSLIGLVTHHAPTNPQVEVSGWVSGLLVTFYAVGCVVSYHYDATRLSVVDKLALLLYLLCMISPAFVANNLATLTPIVAWSMGIGMAALIASFAFHRPRRRKAPSGA